ncbi:MAG: hypothetical protein JST68_01285 [Bacteroidetes bacterium]|nr:hypothetical protein [Bacteroidota bacterium]
MLITPSRPILTMLFLLLAVLPGRQSLFAQNLIKERIPGTAFIPEGRGENVVFDNVAGGRRFRGKAFAKVLLRASVRIPPPTSAEAKLYRLVLHFRTSKDGPSLRAVELRSGLSVNFRITTNLRGDFTTVERVAPASVANAWAWKIPFRVYPQSVVRLEIQFPGGFDSEINPGEFVLTSVELGYPEG